MKRLCALLLAALLLLSGCAAGRPDGSLPTLTVTFLDVGKADCILLEAEGCAAMIDAGNQGDAEEILALLSAKGISSLDFLLLTHLDKDHIGGADALIVQDLAAAALARQICPELPLHASTQMSIHSLEGVLEAAALGCSRVVLARELPAEEIAHICKKSPVEIEVFVHGALCMCYSGQCYLSSVIGRRSGNRGQCAQPCRLPYGYGRFESTRYPLSLKDNCLAGTGRTAAHGRRVHQN